MSNLVAKNNELPLAATHLVRDNCLCLHVHRAARALARRFDDVLRPLDLTNGQFSLLMSLNRREPASIGSVSALLAMDRTTLTANLKPLVKRRLAEIAIDPNDKRSRLLKLTDAGQTVLASAVPIWEQTHKAAEQPLKKADVAALRTGLRAVS